ncbi:MAG: hypothetical protein QXM75_03640 [Candidatus Diapherotrites archaeon]
MTINRAEAICNSGSSRIDMNINAEVTLLAENVPKDNLSAYDPKCLVYVNLGNANNMQIKTLTDYNNCRGNNRCDVKITAKATFKHAFDSEDKNVRAGILCYRSGCISANTCDLKDDNKYVFDMTYCFAKDINTPKTSISPDISSWRKDPVDVTLSCTDVGVGCSSIYYKKVSITESNLFLDIWNNRNNKNKLMLYLENSKEKSLRFDINEPTLIVYASKDFAGNFENPNLAYVKIDNFAPKTEFIASKAYLAYKDTFDLNIFDSSRWEDTNWTIIKTDYRGGIATAKNTRAGTLVSKSIDLSDSNSAVLEFWGKKEYAQIDDKLYLYFCNEHDCTLVKELSNEMFQLGKDFKIDIDPRYRNSNFRIKFDAKITSSQANFGIDDVRVIKNQKVYLRCSDSAPYDLAGQEVELASGCKQTYYQINYDSWSTGNEFDITDVGCHKVTYKSFDRAENTEPENVAEFCVSDLNKPQEPRPSPSPTPAQSPSPSPTQSPVTSPTAETPKISPTPTYAKSPTPSLTQSPAPETSPNQDTIRIGKIIINPPKPYEGTTVSFELEITPALEGLRYFWEFGDDENLETTKPYAQHTYYLPHGFQDYEKEYNVKVNVIKEGTRIGYTTTKLTVTSSYIKLHMLKPTKGSLPKKTENLEVRAVFLDHNYAVIDSSRIKSVTAKIENLNVKSYFDGNELVILYKPSYKTQNVTQITVYATVSASYRDLNIIRNLQIYFEPIALELYRIPFTDKTYPINSMLDSISVRIIVPDINIPVKMQYLSGRLTNGAMTKTLKWNEHIKCSETDCNISIVHRITADDFKKGLWLYLEDGYDQYGNLFFAMLEVPISKDNPLFDLELSSYDINAIRGGMLSLEGYVKSVGGLKSNVDIECETGFNGVANYDQNRDIYVLNIPLKDIHEKEFICEARATAIDKNMFWVAIEKFSVNVLDLDFDIVSPKQSVNYVLLPIKEFKVKIKTGGAFAILEDNIFGKLEVDGKTNPIIFRKSGGDLYIAELQEPIGFGEHYVKLTLEKPYNFQKEMVLIVKMDEQPIQVLALIASILLFSYLAAKIILKKQEAKSKIKELEEEEENLETLIKRLKVAYLKKQISKNDFEERYREASLRLAKIRKMIKEKTL